MPATTEPPDKHDGKNRKSRLESEIEEILARAERDNPLPPPIPFRQPRKKRTSVLLASKGLQGMGSSARRWLTAGPFIVAFMLAIIAKMLSDISPLLAHLAVSLAVIAFFWPILEHYRNRQSGGTPSTMWRGREMYTREEGPSPWEQFRRWLRNRRLHP